MSAKLRAASFAAAVTAFAAAGLARHGLGQPPPAAPGATPGFIGATNCFGCHDDGAKIYPKAATEFLLLRESAIWKTQDLHAKAFAALRSDLGRRMGEALGYDVTTKAECLVCHAVDLSPGQPLAKKTFHTDSGVGCEACHGVATNWFARHIAPTLRTATPQEKEALGLWDMRDPVRRAERCASCHVGSAAEGRFVTHAMYAAGHPPLPPLEVMAFSRDQPMHHKPPGDWPFIADLARRDADQCWRLYHHRADEVMQARQVAVGALMTLRAQAKLLAEAAAPLDPAKEALDLAHFDCFACHHDLQSPSRRPQRGPGGAVGRPQPRTGPALLARIVAAHALPNAAGQLTERFTSLTAAFDARPFGVPKDVAAAANAVASRCDEALKELDKVRYTRAETAKLLRALVDAGKTPTGRTDPWLDADAAQQLVWACEVLRAELEPADGPIGQALATLKDRLPRTVRDTANADWLAAQLGERLRRQYTFEPKEFHTAFDRIAALLASP